MKLWLNMVKYNVWVKADVSCLTGLINLNLVAVQLSYKLTIKVSEITIELFFKCVFETIISCTYCMASPSRCHLPPLLSSSLLLPRTRRPAVRRDAIYHRRNNYWRRFIVRKFQANSSSPFFSLFIFLLPLCFLLVRLPSAPFLSFPIMPLYAAPRQLRCRSDSH